MPCEQATKVRLSENLTDNLGCTATAILLTLTNLKNYGLIVKKQAVNMPPVLTI
jgi:biotin operon repressor